MPEAQRYTDFRFRRVAGKFYADGLDQADAIELACIVRLITPGIARWCFRWRGTARREAGLVLDRFSDLAEPYYRTNLERLTPELGLALIQAAREGGWKGKGYHLPEFVRMTFIALRSRGMTVDQIADYTGFGSHTVSHTFRRPRRVVSGSIGVVL